MTIDLDTMEKEAAAEFAKHKCPHCGRQQYMAGARGACSYCRQHINNRRKPMNDKKHLCPECGNEFITAGGLGSHRYRAHGINSDKTAAAKKPAAPKPKPESTVKDIVEEALTIKMLDVRGLRAELIAAYCSLIANEVLTADVHLAARTNPVLQRIRELAEAVS